jgi:ribosomal protein S18 acetylase RimI-like enzyme
MMKGMSDTEVLIRLATPDDLPGLGRLGAQLVELHYAIDDRRFMRAGGGVADGYARFLGNQLKNADAVVFAAEYAGAVVGYLYAAIEPVSWQDLRDESGFIHDLIVDEAMRGRGVATRLMTACFDWMRSRGMPRVLLHTASKNAAAQRLFLEAGFRPTMIEMTREIEDAVSAPRLWGEETEESSEP